MTGNQPELDRYRTEAMSAAQDQEDLYSEASVFVLKFKDSTPQERSEEIFHSVFRYLDTCSDHQFSLFDYNEVSDVELEKIDGSLVYDKQ